MTAHVVTILLALVGFWQDARKSGTTEPQPIVPLAASTLAATPDPYVGSRVSVTARVREALGGTAFTIDQDPSGPAHDVLVLAPLLTAPVQPRTSVTVIGEVIKFDESVVVERMKDTAPRLAPDVAARYAGRATLIATSVINASMTDLAKRPMLPGEEALDKTMKQVGSAFNALRGADALKAAEAADNAAALKKAFADVKAFWTSNGRADAVQWTQQAQAESAAIGAAVQAGRLDEVKAATGRLQSICQSCHDVYRERLEDGTYRLKGMTVK